MWPIRRLWVLFLLNCGMEEDRTPVGRPDFKSGEARATCLVGSTPTLFRHFSYICQCPLWFGTLRQHV
jgi:hypothetical protein